MAQDNQDIETTEEVKDKKREKNSKTFFEGYFNICNCNFTFTLNNWDFSDYFFSKEEPIAETPPKKLQLQQHKKLHKTRNYRRKRT